jgi:hypothetical protein
MRAYNLSDAGTFPQPTMTPAKPEEIAREQIDAQLASSGWVVQDMADLNLSAASDVLADLQGRAISPEKPVVTVRDQR